MTMTYFLHGGPEGEPRTLPDQADGVAHVLTIERRTEPGTVDLYLLTTHSETFRTAAYQWHSGGTPEDVMKTFAELAREAQR